MFSRSWCVVFDGQRVACINIVDWPESARTLLARVESHIAAERDPELARAHLVRGRAALSRLRVPAFMEAFLALEMPH
jgi:hypothetical protein